MSEKERIHNLELEVKHLYDMFINHVHEAKTDKPLIVREKKEKQSPEMTQPREASKAVQSMNSESNSINSAYGADGLLDNSVSPRNREQNFLKPTVCAYKEDVPNCEVIDCNDCPHTMKPRKENQEFPSPEKQQEILREAIDYAKNPRKEKCRVGGVPQNVPSCKELKPEVFRDCQGYTSKIVKKENKQK